MLLSTFQALLWNHTNSIWPAWLEDCVGIVAFCKTGIRTPSRNCLLLVDCRGWHHCDHFHHLNHHYNHNLFLLLLLFRSFFLLNYYQLLPLYFSSLFLLFPLFTGVILSFFPYFQTLTSLYMRTQCICWKTKWGESGGTPGCRNAVNMCTFKLVAFQ